MKKLIYIFGLLACLASCSESFLPEGVESGEIEVGEKVQFTTSVPKTVAVTRALNTELLNGYKTIADDYEVEITMLKGGNSAIYLPISTTEGSVVTYDSDGTLKLKAGQTPLLWESNTTKYAFEATAGTDAIATDQSSPELWLAQDRLHGYAFSPFEPENGEPADRIDAPNYHTSKEWYQLNKAWHDAEGLMVDPKDQKASENYKKIPLFLQHERAWITIILKAGKGVKREAVAALYNEKDKTYNPNVLTNILTYPKGGGTPIEINKPLKGMKTVHYEEDVNGGAADSLNLKFDAIVEPHNYLENPKDDKIAAINLSDLHFSFYASNDKDFNTYSSALETVGNVEDLEGEAKRVAESYNLTAGKHLTIEATLSTDRIVFITAWIEDWTEVVTSTICDDYGQNGDPTVIKSREELIAFLGDNDLNRAGNVAIIAATELDLDKAVTGGDTPTITDDSWANHSTYMLNATLNLAGATLKSSGKLFTSISSTGNLLHGTVVMNNTEALPTAIAQTNAGTIDNITLMVGNRSASATRASFVEFNHGYILNSSSSLPVRAGDESSETYIGGIAAQSIAPDQSTSPTIDHCTMYAAVKGGTNVKGGGIVGLGEGRLTNNRFDYGITLLQSPENFKNIIHTKDESGDLNTLTVSGNSWPTIAENSIAGTNASSAKYHNVLDCQEELDRLLTDTYNKIDYRYRVANDFTVMAEAWDHASATEDITSQTDHCSGNLYCELDGNGKTITLDTNGSTVKIPTKFNPDGTASEYDPKTTVHMLFSNITGYVHDMTLELNKPLIANPVINADNKYNATEAIAALAYSVRQPATLGNEGTSGNYGVIRNVKVKMTEGVSYVQGATAAGLVCWVHHNGVVDNCQVKGSVLSWSPDNSIAGNSTDAKRYVGGVVACAAKGTINNSTYYYYSSQRTLDIVDGSGTMQTYYGGILGGTAIKDISGAREEPKVSIVDCASWYQATFNGSTAGIAARRQHGAILGYSYYTKDAATSIGTATEGEPSACQGNWWQADMDGVAQNGLLNGYTVATTIGKRNAVTPVQDNF